MAEPFGVQGRGSFYEEVGAIRDVIQNHLLQVVAFLAMEPPLSTQPDPIRDEVAKLLRAIRPLSPGDLVRGQFAGYRNEPGVAPNSTVETYAAVRLFIDSWRWEGVPFYIRAGKCLPVLATEALVTLRRPPLRRLEPRQLNYVRFRLGPSMTIGIGARLKKPGENFVSEQTQLKIVNQPEGDGMLPYERLLGDAMAGDPALFSREDAVEAAWTIVDPVVTGQVRAETPQPYQPGTWGPEGAGRMAADVGGWHPLPP